MNYDIREDLQHLHAMRAKLDGDHTLAYCGINVHTLSRDEALAVIMDLHLRLERMRLDYRPPKLT